MLKAQPNFSRLGLRCQVRAQHEEIWDALIALPLEVMLRQPEGIEALLIHLLGDPGSHVEALYQTFVGVTALVGGRPINADVLQLDVADVENGEMLDHSP